MLVSPRYDFNTPIMNPDLALVVDLQSALNHANSGETEAEEPPGSDLINVWAQTAYAQVSPNPCEVTIRLVDAPEMRALNLAYRSRDKATNVLSFPVQLEPEITNTLELPLLGDIVICHEVVVAEARIQQKSINDHYAHMVTHGILHLCGFDHENESEAAQMEQLEAQALTLSGIDNPYD